MSINRPMHFWTKHFVADSKVKQPSSKFNMEMMLGPIYLKQFGVFPGKITFNFFEQIITSQTAICSQTDAIFFGHTSH